MMNRRQFAIVAGSAMGFSAVPRSAYGATLADSLLAEVEQTGELSRATVKLFFDALTDLSPTEKEIDGIKSSLERTLKSIHTIRAYQLRQSVEPATVLVVRR